MTTNEGKAPGAIERASYMRTFHNPLFDILTTIANKIEREARDLDGRAKGLRIFCLSHVRVARKTFESIEGLVFDRAHLALGTEVAVALPPLASVIVESIFTLTYIFDEPPRRLPFFWHTAWASLAMEHHQLSSQYGARPEWQDQLEQLARQRDGWRDQLQKEGTPLPPEWLTDLAQASAEGRWPAPAQMAIGCNDGWRNAVLSYLNTKLYAPLARSAHLTGIGMHKQASLFIPSVDEASKSRLLDSYLSEAMTAILTLVTHYAIDAIPDQHLATRIIALWQTDWLPPMTKAVYASCYKEKLSAI